MENKKGIQLSEAFGAVLAVVLIAVLVIIGIVLFEALATTGIDQARVGSDDSGFSNRTGYTLESASACGFESPVITAGWNASADVGTVLALANFTVSDAGVVTNASDQEWLDVNFTYTYTDKGATCNATDSTIEQFATYPALVGLVGTIIFLGLVIGVLVASFIFGDTRRV